MKSLNKLTILFYSPFNNRSRDTESLMIAFKNQGHKVISLSQAEGRFIHPLLEKSGIETHSFLVRKPGSIVFNLKHLFHFIFFCYRHRIDIVYSHLETANFVAAIGQYFVSAKVFLCRHHIDEAALRGYDKSLYYRLTYSLAKKIIVVSDRAADHLHKVEKIDKHKILKINLAYDFMLYDKPDLACVAAIQNEAKADILLLTVGRLTQFKRVDASIRVVAQLVKKGLNPKLILLGSGEEESSLVELAKSLHLEDRILFKSYVQNVVDFLSASDFVLHPSVSESSCVVIKEAGLVNKPVIVCSGVGDFDEYIANGENGFRVNKDNFVEEAVEVICLNSLKKEKLEQMGERLNKRVFELFSVEQNISHYDQLNSV